MANAVTVWHSTVMSKTIPPTVSGSQPRPNSNNLHKNLNMLRKFSLNLIKQYKSRNSFKKALSKIMFDCLLDPNRILPLTSEN